jgi:hypothetical protein
MLYWWPRTRGAEIGKRDESGCDQDSAGVREGEKKDVAGEGLGGISPQNCGFWATHTKFRPRNRRFLARRLECAAIMGDQPVNSMVAIAKVYLTFHRRDDDGSA